MRKRVFYPKLALNNLWRNRKTYAPYLLASVVSVFTFYTLLAINLNGALDGIRNETIVKSFTAVGTYILGIFCSILIFYTNSFLIKRRKKELGLYSILGMEKKNIAFVMCFETFFTAGIAIVAGIALGLLFSQLLFWVLLNMVRFPVMVAMKFSLEAILITALLFGIVFICTFLVNLYQVHVANPAALLSGAKQGEREPKASWLLTLVGIICLGGGYFVAVCFDSPMEALMFFLLAVLLVIIGTYCLFTSGSIMLLKILRKNKKFYYRANHFISVSGMIYRMKQNAAGLATICILSCMVLVTVSGTVSLNVGAEDSLKAQFPYEYEMSFESDGEPNGLIETVEKIAADNGVLLVNKQGYEYGTLFAVENEGVFSQADEMTDEFSQPAYINVTYLDELNRNENISLTLADGEAFMLTTGGRYERDEITVNGFTYRVLPLERFGRVVNGTNDVIKTFLIVLPSRSEAEAMLADESFTYSFNFDLEGTEEVRANFNTNFENYFNGERMERNINELRFRSRSSSREDWYATNGGFLFLGIYFGILFMLAAVLIIYYKQLSEGYDDAERFEILQKVGMSEKEVKHTINRQILTVFFMPLLVAFIHITVAFVPICRVMVIFGVLNIPLLAISTVLTALVYAAVYLLVFRRTAKTYFGIVKRQSI